MASKIVIPKGIELPSRTAWWACGELNSRRKLAKQRETDLIKTRKKLEDDLNQFGDRKCADRTRVCELLIDTQRAIEATRNEIKWLADQMQDAFDHANQPQFWEDEDKVAAMLGEPPAKREPIDDLIAAAADIQVESGEVGEPGGGEGGSVADAAPPGLLAPDNKGGPMIANGTPVDVRDQKGQLVATGLFDGYLPADEKYSVVINGFRNTYRFPNFTIHPIVKLSTLVRVIHVVTNEVKGEGELEGDNGELYRVRIGGKLKDFASDVYRIEAVAAAAEPAATAKLERGASVRVLSRETGEIEASGVVHTLHEQYAIVTVGGRQRRFAFDAWVIEVDAAPAAAKPAKKQQGFLKNKK